jgi:hypothetical protein
MAKGALTKWWWRARLVAAAIATACDCVSDELRRAGLVRSPSSTPNQPACAALLVSRGGGGVECQRRASHMGPDDRDLIRLRFLVRSRLFLPPGSRPSEFRNLSLGSIVVVG